MIQIASRIQGMKSSPTIAMAERARELRARGRSIISLASGEPDFDTPQHIRQAGIDAIRRGETRYTDVAGTPALRKAVAAKFLRENGLDYATDEIIVGTGAKQLISNALVATLEAGDEVIVPAPYWVSYPDMIALAGGVPVPLSCPAENGFRIDPAALEAAIGDNTRWLILNAPGNPSGAVYTREELGRIGEVLLRHPQVAVMADDIYEHLRYDDGPFWTIAQVEPRLRDRVLTVNGVSKAYAMTGWRIGYAGGPRKLIREMVKIQSQTTSNATSVAQAAATAALEGPQDCVAEGVAKYRRRRDMVLSILRTAPGLTVPSPSGAFYILADVSRLIGGTTPDGTTLDDDAAVCMHILDAAGVAVVPGSAFGMPGTFRMTFAAGDDDLRTACEAIVAALAKPGVVSRRER